MSLREKLREGLYDAEHKPRLAFARNYFLGFGIYKDLDFQELIEYYLNWRDDDEYLILQKQIDNLRIEGEVKKQTFAIKCAKRGNDVYWRRIDKRLRFLRKLRNRTLFDPRGNVKSSNVLFVTLTFDVKRCLSRDAWEQIGEDLNNWIRNLRNKFGKISYLRIWEASQRGYPHVHLLMIFPDYDFRIAFSRSKHKRTVYRIKEKKEFEKSWHSFVDVQAIRKMRTGIAYVTKYLSKSQHPSITQYLTLALCWIFKKRSFAVSCDFQERITVSLHARKTRWLQVDLFGSALAS